MDIIEMTRELGRALQNDERYIAMMAARQASDEDEALQEAIGEFNLKRMAISNEAQKEERDDETLRRLNDEFRAVYQKIMENEHMLRYNDAKNEFDALLQQMTGILSLCAEGEDPATCDASSCGGNCASCAGSVFVKNKEMVEQARAAAEAQKAAEKAAKAAAAKAAAAEKASAGTAAEEKAAAGQPAPEKEGKGE